MSREQFLLTAQFYFKACGSEYIMNGIILVTIRGGILSVFVKFERKNS